MLVITSDNPRTEDPERILDEIIEGIQGSAAYIREPDRRKAIRCAAAESREGDVVVVAGKGHEDYQIVGRERIHLDDRELLREAMA